MKKFLSLKLAIVLLLSSLSSLAPVSIAYARTTNCENGECVGKLIAKLEDLGAVYSQECLPEQGKKISLEVYHQENGLSEKCWKLMTEINHLEGELSTHQARLEQKLGCENGDCNKAIKTDSNLHSQINALTKVEQNLSCTEPMKAVIRSECPQDLNCVLAATALGVGGFLGQMLIPENQKPKNCHLGDDSCLTQLAGGFLKAVISFFEGSWDLLKMAGNKMMDFWQWVAGAEDHSSTSQLALAKASEDPGVFDMLKNDFPGTIKKIWSGFVVAMKEWLKTDILCQEWSAVPHMSTCLRPTESFDCVSCKTFANGLCAVSGTILAEVIPAFVTGGLITAAKHGAGGAVKIAKSFKVSSTAINAIKNSRVVEVIKVSKVVRATKLALDITLNALRKYLLSPVRLRIKESLAVMTAALKKGGAYVAQTKTGKVIIMGGTATKLTGRMVLYTIDNPLTTFAYKAGQTGMLKVLKLGAPRLGVKNVVTTALIRNEKELEKILIEVEEAKLTQSKKLPQLEEELLSKVISKRRKILEESLKEKDVEFSEIINHLYPELKHGHLASRSKPEKILAARKELLSEIQKMPEGAQKAALLKKFQTLIP